MRSQPSSTKNLVQGLQQQTSMLDLHGRSVSNSQVLVNQHIRNATETNIGAIRFVTGRGNHVNARGERGTLFREFPNWFTEENRQKIASVVPGNGYYEVNLKRPDNHIYNFLRKMKQAWTADHLERIKKSAAEGDSESQYLLGYYYQYEAGNNQKHYKLAVKAYQKSANCGNVLGQYALGGCYWQGVGIRRNDAKAIELFKAAAAKDFPWAHHQLGDIYYYGFGVTADPKIGIDHYKRAANFGIDLAKRRLAYVYLHDKAYQNEYAAFKLYKEVADNGDTLAAYNVGYCYFSGVGTPQNFSQALKYFKQAADNGDPDGQYQVSELYHLSKDNNKSFKYLKLAADNKQKHALFGMYMHHLTNPSERLTYLIAAADAGQICAQALVLYQRPSTLSSAKFKQVEQNFWQQNDQEVFSIQYSPFKYWVIDIYMDMATTDERKKRVLNLLQTLANDRSSPEPDACRRLGNIYYRGDFGEENTLMAKKFWQKGANLGSSHCECCFGYFYEDKKDYQNSVRHHMKAAKLGNANSHNQLGIYYKEGKGVDKDFHIASKHFLAAMRLDDGEEKQTKIRAEGLAYIPVFANAAYNLIGIYKHGDGERFPADLAKATVCLFTAAKAGCEDSNNIIDRYGYRKAYLNFPHINFWSSPEVSIANEEPQVATDSDESTPEPRVTIDETVAQPSTTTKDVMIAININPSLDARVPPPIDHQSNSVTKLSSFSFFNPCVVTAVGTAVAVAVAAVGYTMTISK